MTKSYQIRQHIQSTAAYGLGVGFQANNTRNPHDGTGFYLCVDRNGDEIYGAIDLESARKLSDTLSEWISDAPVERDWKYLHEYTAEELLAELGRRVAA